jgi:hypothetical protein
MADEEIEIEIAPDGKVTVLTHGIKGPVCMEYADLFARLLGREEHREKTAEYYEQAELQQRIQINQRR